MKSLIYASSHAFSINSSILPNSWITFSLPKIKFSFIDLLNKTGSCWTYPIKFLKYSILNSFISIPSIRICPSTGSYNLSIKLTVVLFPHPDSPTKATFLPASISKFNPFKIGLWALSLG